MTARPDTRFDTPSGIEGRLRGCGNHVQQWKERVTSCRNRSPDTTEFSLFLAPRVISPLLYIQSSITAGRCGISGYRSYQSGNSIASNACAFHHALISHYRFILIAGFMPGLLTNLYAFAGNVAVDMSTVKTQRVEK